MSSEAMIAAMNAVKNMPSVPVKGGKRYTMVKDRIEIFRREFGDVYGIVTEVDYSKGFADGAPVVAQARITNQDGMPLASGWAVEFVGSTDITDASPVEVAETSAIGRALACFGLHGGEYASLNEMEAAQRKQDFRQGNGHVPDHGAYPGGPNDGYPDERQMVNNQEGQFIPEDEREQSPFYVPSDHDAMWLQPEIEGQRMVDQIDNIGSVEDLSMYWNDLQPVIDILKTQDIGLDVIAEVKAAFATRHNMLKGARR